MMLGVLGLLVKPITDLISEVVTDKDEAARINAALTTKMLDQSSDLFKAQSKIITAEASSEHWLAAVWRPITMLVFVFIIANNYVIAPYAAAFGWNIPTLDIPDGMWGLLQLGIGGYIASRGVEKVADQMTGGGAKKVSDAASGAFRSLRK
jgi:hypothetical protein